MNLGHNSLSPKHPRQMRSLARKQLKLCGFHEYLAAGKSQVASDLGTERRHLPGCQTQLTLPSSNNYRQIRLLVIGAAGHEDPHYGE